MSSVLKLQAKADNFKQKSLLPFHNALLNCCGPISFRKRAATPRTPKYEESSTNVSVEVNY